MSKLSRTDVLKLAALSRLKLSDQEIERLQQELSQILGYVEILNSSDTDGLEPTYQVTGLKNVSRPDEVYEYGYKTEYLLKNSQLKDGQIKVKRVL